MEHNKPVTFFIASAELIQKRADAPQNSIEDGRLLRMLYFSDKQFSD
jgi:hypothetical protein